jgi:hypothetical protein
MIQKNYENLINKQRLIESLRGWHDLTTNTLSVIQKAIL